MKLRKELKKMILPDSVAYYFLGKKVLQ